MERKSTRKASRWSRISRRGRPNPCWRTPAASEAFGTLAVGAVDAACERLLVLVESSPAHSTPALRVLGAMAGAASGAMTPTAAAGRIERIVAAFAPFAPSIEEDDDSIEGGDDSIDVPLDAWEASVDACAALVEAATAWDAPEGASEAAFDEAREGEMAAAAAAAAHVAAYWRAAESLEPSDDEDEDDEDETADDGDETDTAGGPPPAHAAVASLLRAAAEVLASSSRNGQKTANSARLAANVPRVCAEWARHLPAWRRQGEAGLVDDASLDDLRDIVAAVSTAGIGPPGTRRSRPSPGRARRRRRRSSRTRTTNRRVEPPPGRSPPASPPRGSPGGPAYRGYPRTRRRSIFASRARQRGGGDDGKEVRARRAAPARRRRRFVRLRGDASSRLKWLTRPLRVRGRRRMDRRGTVTAR